jgi:hypothetical protein
VNATVDKDARKLTPQGPAFVPNQASSNPSSDVERIAVVEDRVRQIELVPVLAVDDRIRL